MIKTGKITLEEIGARGAVLKVKNGDHKFTLREKLAMGFPIDVVIIEEMEVDDNNTAIKRIIPLQLI